MTAASPPRALDYVLLVALAAIWGASFMLIKLAIDTVPPVTMTAARVIISVAVFVAIVLATGRRLPRAPQIWGWAALGALFGFTLPFTLISWGEETVDSGLAAVLMAGMPLMTILLARFVARDEPLTIAKLAGVALGMFGLIILIGPGQLATLGGDTIREIAIVLASFCYGVGAIVIKRISGHDPYVVSATILICAAIMLVPASVLIDQPWTLNPTGLAIFAVVLLGLLATGLANLLMLALLRRTGAGFFAQINFLVPLFGVFWGFVILSERPTPSALAALALILAGIAISRVTLRAPRLISTETSK